MTKAFRQLTLPLILALLSVALFPVSAEATIYTSYENYTANDDADDSIFGACRSAQTFTTNSTPPGESHTVNVLRLMMYKQGTPGTLTASIYAVNSTGAPTGTQLTYGTYDASVMTTNAAGAWYDVIVSELTLDANETYAIVCSGTGADAANDIHWRYDTAGATYSGGHGWNSTTGGATWGNFTGRDFMFEVFGLPAMEIIGANVYEGYVYDDDWIVVVEYKNTWEPFYSEDLAKSSFLLQLTHVDDTLIGQVPLQSWDYYPGSIYLSNVTTASLDWGPAYKVKLHSVDSPYYNITYTLTESDWRGGNMPVLDDWCRSAAGRMVSYYGVALTVMTAEKGEVLNEAGGTIFLTGIPYLDQVRPGLFQVALGEIPYTEPTWAGGYSGGLATWEVAVGPEFAAILTDCGTLINVNGKDLGMLLIFLAYVAVAAGSFVIGHGMAGVSLAIPILILGVYFGFIPWAALGVGIAIAVAFWARQLWWSST